MKAKPKVYFENLDGLRTICFLAVFFYHSFATKRDEVLSSGLYRFIKYTLFGNGNLGVNFFFVLSGFLITYLLLEESRRYGGIKLGAFYVRRLLRIWPLFYGCVFFGFVIFPILKLSFGQQPEETADWRLYCLFLSNFDFLAKGIPDCSSLSVLWSVAIEEQFYLFWPILLMLVPRRGLVSVFLCILIGSFAFRFWNSDSYLALQIHTLSCISDMTVGGLFAVLVKEGSGFKERVVSAPRWVWVALYFALIFCYFLKDELFGLNSMTKAVDRLVFSFIFGLIILEQNFAQNSLYKMKNHSTLTWLGKYTYGLYCLHMIGILIAAVGLGKMGWNRYLWQIIVIEGGLSLALTIVLAYLSYEFYEKKFLKLKSRFARIIKK